MRAVLLVALPSILVMACMEISGEGRDHDGDNSCVAGGCSGQLCTDDPNVGSTCEWRDAYACYAEATCARQDDGKCGWTQTAALSACLESPPAP